MLTDDNRSLSVSRKFSKNLKENFPNHKRKNNVVFKLWHEVNTKTFEYFLADDKEEPWYDSETSADGKKTVQFKYLNSMTPFF